MKRENVEVLRETVMSEVERDRQRILKYAQSQAQGLLTQARGEAEGEKDRIIEDAETEADRLHQQVIGAAKLEAQALKARTRERLMNQVFEQALESLSDPDQIERYPDVLARLIEDAVNHLRRHRNLVIAADPRSRRYLDEQLLGQLSDATGCNLSLGDDLEPPTLGVVVMVPDGRIRYDNTLQTRLSRMRDALRPAVYRILMGEEA